MIREHKGCINWDELYDVIQLVEPHGQHVNFLNFISPACGMPRRIHNPNGEYILVVDDLHADRTWTWKDV